MVYEFSESFLVMDVPRISGKVRVEEVDTVSEDGGGYCGVAGVHPRSYRFSIGLLADSLAIVIGVEVQIPSENLDDPPNALLPNPLRIRIPEIQHSHGLFTHLSFHSDRLLISASLCG